MNPSNTASWEVHTTVVMLGGGGVEKIDRGKLQHRVDDSDKCGCNLGNPPTSRSLTVDIAKQT